MNEQHISKKELRKQRTAEKELRREKNASQARNKKILFMSVLIIGTVAMIWAVARSQKNISLVDISPDPKRGPAEAKVVVREYADFQCPACAATYPVLDDILEEYGDQVQFVYNDFPLPQHANAVDAAIVGQCALDQNVFFEMHDLLFDRQRDWQALGKQQAKDMFTSYAQELGMDMTAFAACTTGESAAARVNEDVAEGNAAKVNSTPTFFVNGERISNTPFSTNLRKAIDAALAKN